MQAQYNIVEDFALRIRFLPSLAFVSPLDVRQYFEAVVEHLPMPASQELILYFERTYIGRRLPGGNHQDPIYPIETITIKSFREFLGQITQSKHGIDHIMRLSDVTIQIFGGL